MKLNKRFVQTQYEHTCNGNVYEFGFYYGGNGFFACNGELTEPDSFMQELGIRLNGKTPTIKNMVEAIINTLHADLPF